jgi:hypothetical protein
VLFDGDEGKSLVDKITAQGTFVIGEGGADSASTASSVTKKTDLTEDEVQLVKVRMLGFVLLVPLACFVAVDVLAHRVIAHVRACIR